MTSIFVHQSFMHLFSNLLLYFSISHELEQSYSSLRMAAVWLLTGALQILKQLPGFCMYRWLPAYLPVARALQSQAVTWQSTQCRSACFHALQPSFISSP